jgi:hypothetical protein
MDALTRVCLTLRPEIVLCLTSPLGALRALENLGIPSTAAQASVPRRQLLTSPTQSSTVPPFCACDDNFANLIFTVRYDSTYLRLRYSRHHPNFTNLDPTTNRQYGISGSDRLTVAPRRGWPRCAVRFWPLRRQARSHRRDHRPQACMCTPRSTTWRNLRNRRNGRNEGMEVNVNTIGPC